MRESGRKKKERKRETIRNRARLTDRREGRRRELVWGSNWSQRSFDRRWKEEVMRSETAQMNRQGRWMQTRTGGDEIKERQEGEGEKKHSDGRLKYLWCHLCWRMTPPLCNNMNEDGTGCLESPNFTTALYIAVRAFVFRGVSALIEAPFECGGRWKRLLRKKQRHNVTNEFHYLKMKNKCTTKLWLQALVNILLLSYDSFISRHYGN